jgi:hypothetical protein
MDYDAMLKQALFNIENDMYNKMMFEVFGGANNYVEEAGVAFILALNRHGVSSKVIYEALMEVAKELKE